MNSLEKAAQAVLVRWDSPAWDWANQGPTAALMADLREALAAHKQAEPVVEPVVDRERPIGWLYPEGMEALRAGKPWTIYGKRQDHSNTPVYGAVAQKAEPHESESVEGSIPSLRHQRIEAWKTQQDEPVAEPVQAAVLESLKAIVEFADAPAEGKRPDVFFMRINNARAAIARAEQAVHGIGEKE